jgi:hypothetical protein
MPVLTTVWNFIKAHWQAIALVLVIAVGYGWIHHLQAGYVDTIKKLNDSHQVEIDKIKQDHVVEEQQHAAELKALQDSIAKIQADYVAAQAALQQQQTQEQKDIVKKYGNDADGLANLLAGKMGFVVTKP